MTMLTKWHGFGLAILALLSLTVSSSTAAGDSGKWTPGLLQAVGDGNELILAQ